MPSHTFVRGDVRDPAAVHRAFEGCDAVMHLAAAHHDFGIDEPTYYDVNEAGARVMCEAMDELGIRKLCFYSSVAVYGDAPEPRSEDIPPQPNSTYGKSKLAGEKVFETWAQQGDGRHCLVIRPGIVIGPRNFANMYSLIRQIDSRKFLRVGPGTNVKSFTYVGNAVGATLYLWDRTDAPPFDVFNMVDLPHMSSRAISEAIYRALGRPIPKLAVPMWLALLGAIPFDVLIAITGKNIPISSARVKKLFSTETKFAAQKVLDAGFEPVAKGEEGIRSQTEWFVQEGKGQTPEWHTPPAEVVRLNSDR